VNDVVLAVIDLGGDGRVGQRELDRLDQVLDKLVPCLRTLLKRLHPN
jgi:hypothetical protein